MNEVVVRNLARFARLQFVRACFAAGSLPREEAIELLQGPLSPGQPETAVDDSKLLDAEQLTGWVVFEDTAPLSMLQFTLDVMRFHKPGDRSEKDRYMAIAITDMEKLVAFYEKYLTT